jgi:hypothetical protein
MSVRGARSAAAHDVSLHGATKALTARERDDLLYRDESQHRAETAISQLGAWLAPSSVAAHYVAVGRISAADVVPAGSARSDRGFSAKTEELLATRVALNAGLQIIEARRRRRAAELAWPLSPPADLAETRPHHSIHLSPFPCW